MSSPAPYRPEEYSAPEIPEHRPILYLSRSILTADAKHFLAGFPGTVLYAVKCNPDSDLLRILRDAGISHFDVASLGEIKIVDALFPDAHCYFNHPVKEPSAIRSAYFEFGIRDYVVDCLEELQKVAANTQMDSTTIQVRLSVPSGSSSYDFSQKFGASPGSAIEICRAVCATGAQLALSFHVGSQCVGPQPYVEAMQLCRGVYQEVGVRPRYINVGGGFPAAQSESGAGLGSFFECMREARDRLELPPLLAEPGRALVWRAGTLVTQVVLRNHDRLYLNDGVYGALGEINYAKIPLVVEVLRSQSHSSERKLFRLFGPTCDSFDAIDQQVLLPETVQTGDWLLIDGMGAYSTALSSRFNGFEGPAILTFD